MPTATKIPLASITLSSAINGVQFGSISQSYTDLILVVSSNGSRASLGGDIRCQFNGDTGSNYSYTMTQGLGSSVWNERASSQTYINMANNIGLPSTSDYVTTIMQFFSYSNTTTYKTCIVRHAGVTSGNIQMRTGLWRSTSSISSIYLWNEAGALYNFNAGTTFNLYGIL